MSENRDTGRYTRLETVLPELLETAGPGELFIIDRATRNSLTIVSGSRIGEVRGILDTGYSD